MTGTLSTKHYRFPTSQREVNFGQHEVNFEGLVAVYIVGEKKPTNKKVYGFICLIYREITFCQY